MVRVLAIILAIAIAVCSYGVSAQQPERFHNILSRITMDMNYMLQMIDQLSEIDQGLASSPYSVILPLKVLLFFARGYSQRQLVDFLLNPHEWEPQQLLGSSKSQPESSKKTVVQYVERMFYQKNLKLTQHFVDLNMEIGVQLSPVDFGNVEAAANEINSIVATDTDNLIDSAVHPSYLDPKTEIMLVSALRVKSLWKCQFEDIHGQSLFYRDDGKTDVVPSMFQVDFIKFTHSDELQSTILVLPFSDEDYDFVLIAPDENQLIKKVSTKLQEDPSLLNRALDTLETYIVEVTMPKFTVKSNIFMRRALEDLGVTNIMDPRVSNLRDIYVDGHDAYVSSMAQKVVVDINEEGLAASTATKNQHSNSSRGYGARPYQNVVVNKPFLYIIRDRGYELIMGSYQGLVSRHLPN